MPWTLLLTTLLPLLLALLERLKQEKADQLPAPTRRKLAKVLNVAFQLGPAAKGFGMPLTSDEVINA